MPSVPTEVLPDAHAREVEILNIGRDEGFAAGLRASGVIVRRLSPAGRRSAMEAIADCISPLKSNEPGAGTLEPEACASWLRVMAAQEGRS